MARRPDLAFTTEQDAEPRTMPLTVKDAEPLKRVRVLAPFRVVYETRPYTDGDTPEVPEALAQEWVRNRWAEELPEREGR